MPSAATEAQLRQLLDGSAFLRSYGFRLESAREGECTLRVPFHENLERPGGIVNGQVMVAAADVAMWFAIMTKLGTSDGSVTAEMKTNFLRAARKEDFLCRAKILKLGKRLIYGTAECTTQSGKLIAHHTITYIRPDANESA